MLGYDFRKGHPESDNQPPNASCRLGPFCVLLHRENTEAFTVGPFEIDHRRAVGAGWSLTALQLSGDETSFHC